MNLTRALTRIWNLDKDLNDGGWLPRFFDQPTLQEVVSGGPRRSLNGVVAHLAALQPHFHFHKFIAHI